MQTSVVPCTVAEALAQLDRVAPAVPLLALGQTVFWDEPMKAGVALAAASSGTRKFVAGVHDTDYFAKLPAHDASTGFAILPHNDTTTKGLWSAAGEFSSLFGAELVISRELLNRYGLKVARLNQARKGFLDQATEAWGWKGIVSLAEHAPITAQVPFEQIQGILREAFSEMLTDSTSRLAAESKRLGEEAGARYLEIFDEEAARRPATLGDFYSALLPRLFEMVAAQEVEIDTTRTTELLKFNVGTCGRPRFELLDVFLNPETREHAEKAYNQAVDGLGIFGLSRFGTGALPFDVVLPGKGRGTLRVGNRGIVIQTPEPQFISLRQPVTCACDLAEALQRKFGEEVVLIGKALTLISMLSREFVFVFHHGASSYVDRSTQFHQSLAQVGFKRAYHPILRVRYDSWSALNSVKAWFSLPEPLRRPFGADEVCAPSFASRWHEVRDEQTRRLGELAELRRPVDLLCYLEENIGGAWSSVAEEYRGLNHALSSLKTTIEDHRAERQNWLTELRQLGRTKEELERAKGDHFRAFIFEKDATNEQLKVREEFVRKIEQIDARRLELKQTIRKSIREQAVRVKSEEIQNLHHRRRDLEIEGELKRLKLIRNALISSRGLTQASERPSSWWFPLVSKDGAWFRQTYATARAYLQELS